MVAALVGVGAVPSAAHAEDDCGGSVDAGGSWDTAVPLTPVVAGLPLRVFFCQGHTPVGDAEDWYFIDAPLPASLVVLHVQPAAQLDTNVALYFQEAGQPGPGDLVTAGNEAGQDNILGHHAGAAGRWNLRVWKAVEGGLMHSYDVWGLAV